MPKKHKQESKIPKKQKDILLEIPKEIEVEVFASGPRDKSAPKLGHIDLEFGREDLNQLRSKLNEVIDFINTL